MAKCMQCAEFCIPALLAQVDVVCTDFDECLQLLSGAYVMSALTCKKDKDVLHAQKKSYIWQPLT